MPDPTFTRPPADSSHQERPRLLPFRTHPLLTFLVLAFGIEWLLLGLNQAFGGAPGAAGFALLVLLISYGVAAAAWSSSTAVSTSRCTSSPPRQRR